MRHIVRILIFACAVCAAFDTANAKPASTSQPSPVAGVADTNGAAPAATSASTTAAPIAGVVGNGSAFYSDFIPANQIVTLAAGSDKFKAWHIADLTGQPRGAVIVLPDSGHLPSWPTTAAALIDDLPLHGWDTLNIELPVPSADTPAAEIAEPNAATPNANATTPAATTASAATNTPKTATPPAAGTKPADTTPADVEKQAQARIAAAIKFFTDRGEHNIVLIGFGSGALRAAAALPPLTAANTAPPGAIAPITALVMIAPLRQLDGIEMNLPQLLPLTTVPALDLTLDGARQTRADAELRRRAVLHQRTRVYTQLELTPLDASDSRHSEMVKRVRSWLQKYALAPQKSATTQPTNKP